MGSTVFKLFLLSLLVFSQVASSAQSKRLYRWVDDQGRVHYSDVVPPKDSQYGRSRMNEKGLTLEKIAPAKTRQQLEQEKRLANLRAEKQKIIAEQLAYDRVLLRTFRNSDEIQMTLDGKLQTIDLLNRLTQDNIKRLKEQLSIQQGKAAVRERNGMRVPKRLLDEINATRRQIDKNHQKVSANNREKERLRNKFNRDMERFLALKEQVNKKTAQKNGDQGLAVVSVAECDDPAACNKSWIRAGQYINMKATTPVQISTSTILMTQKPVNDKDISLTVTRISGSGKQATQLFLDVECKQSNIGQELCASKEVQDILAGFQPFVTDKSSK